MSPVSRFNTSPFGNRRYFGNSLMARTMRSVCIFAAASRRLVAVAFMYQVYHYTLELTRLLQCFLNRCTLEFVKTTEIDGVKYVLASDLATDRGVVRSAIQNAIKQGRLTGVLQFGRMFIPLSEA